MRIEFSKEKKQAIEEIITDRLIDADDAYMQNTLKNITEHIMREVLQKDPDRVRPRTYADHLETVKSIIGNVRRRIEHKMKKATVRSWQPDYNREEDEESLDAIGFLPCAKQVSAENRGDEGIQVIETKDKKGNIKRKIKRDRVYAYYNALLSATLLRDQATQYENYGHNLIEMGRVISEYADRVYTKNGMRRYKFKRQQKRTDRK